MCAPYKRRYESALNSAPPRARMRLPLVGLVVICTISATPNTVEQVFPANVDYCCHCPNIELKCNFSKNPLTASWTVLVSGGDNKLVTTSTPGHTIDTSEMQHGILYLEVNNTVYSKNNSYSCTAVYLDGHAETSEVFVTPMAENISAPIRDLVVAATQDILTVEWYHEYYLCRNFTVIFDDNVVPECTNITALNCTIRNRDIGKVYQVVRVVSTEFYTDLIETSVMTTVFYPNSTGTCCGVSGIYFWLLLVWTVKMMIE